MGSSNWCYVDGSTTCMDARRSLRKAPFQYSCEACVDEGGVQSRSSLGQSVEKGDTESAAEAPNSETSLLPNLLTLLVLVLFPSFCICCLCAWLVRRRKERKERRKERISDSRKLNQAGHIEPTREEIWTSSSSSVRKNSNSIKEEADYGGYTDYEEPTPPAPALENLSRESTGKSIYENMHS